MRDLTLRRKLGTKAKCREQLVTVTQTHRELHVTFTNIDSSQQDKLILREATLRP